MTKPNAPLVRALSGEPCTPPPMWLMRQAGRYLPEYRAVRAEVPSFLDLCLDPVRAAEITLQPIRRYGFDAAILFSDILVIPYALGQQIAFVEGEGPRLEPITTDQDVARLDAGPAADRLAPISETVSRVVDALPPEIALIGFAGAPWTVASYMIEGRGSRDWDRARHFLIREPQAFVRLSDLVVRSTTDYLCRQIEAGADVVQLFESNAGVLSDDDFEIAVIAPTKAIVTAVKKAYPQIPVVGFPRCAGALIDRYVRGTGIDAVGLDTTVPLDWAAQQLQNQCPVQGNLDPLLLVEGGAKMRDRVDRIMAAFSKGPFVFNLGHGVIKTTPPEHVANLVALVRSWPDGEAWREE